MDEFHSFLVFLGIVAAVGGTIVIGYHGTTVFSWWKVKRLYKRAGDVNAMREERALKAKIAARELERKRMDEIIVVSEKLRYKGAVETPHDWVAAWFQSKGFEVKEQYSGWWEISIPAITEKEIADLIVK